MLRQDAKLPRRQEPDQKLDNLAHRVIGAAIEVHHHLGPGFVESVYEEALSHELCLQKIPFERQAIIQVSYKNRVVGEGKIDLWIDRQLVVELKAVETVLPKHKAQAKAYIIAVKNDLALLINFNEALLKDGIVRIVQTQTNE